MAAVGHASAAELNLGALIQPVPLDSKFALSNYYVWCGSAVKGDDGRYHLFYSRWPTSNPNKFAPGWAIVSEVAYAIGDSPRGPFTHVNVALPKRGTNAADFDSLRLGNPAVTFCPDGKILMIYKAVTAASGDTVRFGACVILAATRP